jgi:tRNA threonylcarbamoyladenosine biosynthesis protein TsaE
LRQSLIAASAEETEAFGARLAQAMPARPAALLQVQLHGDLGAGKTTLARGFLRGLGHSGLVRSPTYTLVETYALGAITVVHADLYRLQDPDEFETLGLRELDLPGHVWLIEWPQRAGHGLPPADLDVSLAAHPAFHNIDIQALTAAGTQWLARIKT